MFVGRRQATNGPKVNLSQPNGPWVPSFLADPARSLPHGLHCKQLTQGCFLIPRPLQKVHLIRPGPPSTISLWINLIDLETLITSENNVQATLEGVTQDVYRRAGILEPLQDPGHFEGTESGVWAWALVGSRLGSNLIPSSYLSG